MACAFGTYRSPSALTGRPPKYQPRAWTCAPRGHAPLPGNALTCTSSVTGAPVSIDFGEVRVLIVGLNVVRTGTVISSSACTYPEPSATMSCELMMRSIDGSVTLPDTVTGPSPVACHVMTVV